MHSRRSRTRVRDKNPNEHVSDEKDNEKNPVEIIKPLKFRDLFRYANKVELILLYLGIFLSAVLGAAFPLAIWVFRMIVNDFMDRDAQAAADRVYRTSIWFTVIALSAFVIAFLQTVLVDYASGRLSHRIRLMFLEAIFRQNIGWFDQQAVGNLINQLSEDTTNIQLGIGVKLTEFVQNISSFVFGLVIAFISGWKLTLIACAMLPLIIFGFVSFGGLTHYFQKKESMAYAKASEIAEEVLRAVRTVFAFGGEEREAKRYAQHLDDAAQVAVKQASCFGLAGGFIGFSVYSAAALVFWYGVGLLQTKEYDAGSVVLVFLNVIIGSLFLGGALPNFRYFYAAKASAQRVFSLMERHPSIDKDLPGLKPESFFQSIRFEDVSFAYESRADKPILEKLNFTIQQNQMAAFVGPSGCGKSTVMHLLQRFYDPAHGKIMFDDVDMRELDLNWYRSQVGVVQQEPIIFTGTIAENIRIGSLSATKEQIVEAAKLANAHQFITKFPEGYDTEVTQGSTALSVGQKQRIAIARALIRNPRILILDEATSALDSQSERIVQTALDQAIVGRTVIVVAHRLTTVQNADQLFVLSDGCVQETGTPAELSQSNGLYAAMLRAQMTVSQDDVKGDETSVKGEGRLSETIPLMDEHTDLKQVSRNSDIITSLELEKNGGSLKSLPLKVRLSNTITRERGPSAWIRVMRLNRAEAGYIILGSISAAVTGAIQPIFAVIYSDIYAVFTMTDDPSAMDSRIRLITGVMALLGLLRLASSTTQAYFFGVSGQRLTRRLRQMMFEAILRQEMAWFDESDNQVGTLTARLASETNKVHPLCGSAMGRVVESTVLVIFSLTVAFVYNWKLTFVVVVFFPVIMLSSFLHIRQLNGGTRGHSDTSAVQVAHEALSSSRTVTALGLERHFHQQYTNCLQSDIRNQKRASIGFGLVYALAQSLPICSYAAAFSFGAYLMSKGELELVGIFRVFAAISFAAQALGRTSHLGPDMRNAAAASRKIFRLLDRKSRIPVTEGMRPVFAINKVPIEFRNVSFRYPSRPNSRVLKDLTCSIQPNEKLAVIGHSGCGKSSFFKLIPRFYDPVAPEREQGILINNLRIEQISPNWLRQQIGIVDQEPHLFNLSLRENIAYGDSTREVQLDEIEAAARRAQIHDFIISLPKGYDTLAGPHGSDLSVGQKQRVAIARMLVRRPNLLLLDEATAALDAPTEQLVQAGLKEVIASHTVISSTHRLSSVVEHADSVLVLADGVVVETGTPAQLIETKGAFYALYRQQTD